MSIMFNGDQFSVNSYTLEETETRRAEEAARGCVPQVLLREDFIHRTRTQFEELYGCYIEVNREACTDDEYAALSKGHALERDNYGSQWRIWTGGFPTEEQMAETPWEGSVSSSLET